MQLSLKLRNSFSPACGPSAALPSGLSGFSSAFSLLDFRFFCFFFDSSRALAATAPFPGESFSSSQSRRPSLDNPPDSLPPSRSVSESLENSKLALGFVSSPFTFI